MQRRFRLIRSSDFKRVRNVGKSFAHPLIVLVTSPARDAQTQIGVVAGKTVGGAVQRNRAKRLLREAVRRQFPGILPGHDLIWIARPSIAGATFEEVSAAVTQQLRRARLLKEPVNAG